MQFDPYLALRWALTLSVLAAGCQDGDADPASEPEEPALDAGNASALDASRPDANRANDAASAPDAITPDASPPDARVPDAAAPDAGPKRTFVDPGKDPWQVVSAAEVRDLCRLDPELLAKADATLQSHNLGGVPWSIVRYGRLCYASHTELAADEAWSTTKTLGAVTLGMVSYQTRELTRGGRKTGPLSDTDRVDHWLDSFSYNKDAQIGHVLAMVAHNADLSYGKKAMSYDVVGAVQINSLSEVMNRAIAQDSRLGANLEEFAQKFVFGPLGMKASSWSGGAPDKTLGYTWSSTALDMARLGLLLLHDGVWNGERLLSEDYVYSLSHPAFEDANTGYGYLTWLNSASNYTFGDIPGAPGGRQQGALSPGPCAPVSIHKQHPHGLSESPDCNYDPPFKCEQANDVGVYAAVGLQGQTIMVHPGLDMVITTKNLTPLLVGGTSDFGFGPDTPKILWDAVLPAVVAGDPKYRGDQAAFCAEYGANRYAPDYHADELTR